MYNEITQSQNFQVAFVWNRTLDKMKGIVPDDVILEKLDDFATRKADLIVEVAHPLIVAQYGQRFLQSADFLIGSPTGLADHEVCTALFKEAEHSHGLYVAVGALWGAQDIQKMADRGTLKGLKITMKKHPSAFKLCGYLAEKLKEVGNDPFILYDGCVKDLCPLAPNNVNTMACAAIAGHNLGFNGVVGCLVADPSLTTHIVEIEVTGPGESTEQFKVHTVRTNPAASGVVTGKLTYASFLSSLLGAHGRGCGIHLC